MENTNFENLEIYQLSEKLTDNIWNIILLTIEQIQVLAEIIRELTPKLNSYIGKVGKTVKDNKNRDH